MPSDVSPPVAAVREAVRLALAEDTLPLGDLTASLVDETVTARAAFVARVTGVVAGTACIVEVCAQVDAHLAIDLVVHDGEPVAAGGTIATVTGPLRAILTAERSALNFLGHLSGVATLARAYVDAAGAARAQTRIWDTRTTTPGLRALEKAAVRAGGAVNHRGNLSEGVLVKDNHLGGLTIRDAVARALERWPGRMIEVECDRVDQVKEALDAGATLVMCDNFTPDQVATAVALVRGHPRGDSVLVEASGGVRLDNVAEYASAGADVISVGALTHSAPALDVGLDLIG